MCAIHSSVLYGYEEQWDILRFFLKKKYNLEMEEN